MKVSENELEFTYSRSAGAGGQNINKVNTKATLIWDIANSSINTAILERFRVSFKQFFTSEGVVKISSQKFRVQSRNRKDCIEKLEKMLDAIKKPPRKRVATKPTKSSVQKRIKDKKNKSEIKSTRKKVDY